MRTVLIRVDSSPIIGSGHIYRCLNLAIFYRNRNCKVIFICRKLKNNFNSILFKNKFSVINLPLPANTIKIVNSNYKSWLEVPYEKEIKDSLNVVSSFKNIDLMIVDHYSIDSLWHKIIRKYVNNLLVIDDLFNKNFNCDFLINHNFNIKNQYKNLINKETKLLLGCEYLLVNNKFNKKKIYNKINKYKIFIFFGSSDSQNLTLRILNILIKIDKSKFLPLVIVGKFNEKIIEIKQILKKFKSYEFYTETNQIHKIIKKSNFAIAAGGVNTYERIRVGLPSLVISVADNQKSICTSLNRAGFINYLGHYDKIKDKSIIKNIINFKKYHKEVESFILKNSSKFPTNSLENVYNNVIMKNKNIIILTSKKSWFLKYAYDLEKKIKSLNYNVKIFFDHTKIKESNITFILSYEKIIPEKYLIKSKNNIVVHASDLPKGKGWSPLTWQILNGKLNIPISLFEAEKKIDSGKIYIKDIVKTKKTDLLNELRLKLAKKTIELCLKFLKNKNYFIFHSNKQKGKSSYFKKRIPEDSKINIKKTLIQNFNLLRVSDYDNYPSYFDYQNFKYKIKIEKIKK